MSLEELQSDFAAVAAKVNALQPALASSIDLATLLQDELVPIMGAIVRELAEVDDTVADMYSQSEDILQPETAGVFATLIVTGRPLLAVLAQVKPELKTKIAAWLDLSKEAEKTLEDITIPDDDDEDDDDEDSDSDNADAKESK